MAVETATSDPILDIEGTLSRFGGDKELFVEMSGIVLEDAPRVMADLGRAVQANNAADVRVHAHAIKGLLAGCGGVRAARVGQALENAGQACDLSRAASLFESLTHEFDQLSRALRQYRA